MNANDGRMRIQVRVRDLFDRVLAEASALPDHGHVPCCHASQGQKESLFLSCFRMPNNPGWMR
jgi:hypothetical protein